MTTPSPDPLSDEETGAAPESAAASRGPAAVGGPRRLLDRAPGERFRTGAEARSGAGPAAGAGPTAGAGRTAATPSDDASGTRSGGGAPGGVPRLIGAAVVVAVIGAAALTLILGVFLSTAGTFAISGIASIVIGLIVANGAIPGSGPSGAGPSAPLLSRDRTVRIAMGIAVGMIALTALGVWGLARLEGGVMDPITYVWTTFGFGLPAQAIIALIGSAWGAANGPIRWRQ